MSETLFADLLPRIKAVIPDARVVVYQGKVFIKHGDSNITVDSVDPEKVELAAHLLKNRAAP